MLVRGPGIKPGSSIPQLVGLPDLAPTILAMADVDADADAGMDGRSLLPLLRSKQDRPTSAAAFASSWRKAYLIEYIATQEGVKGDSTGHVIDVGNNTFRGLRLIDLSSTPPVDLAYFEFTDPYADWDWAAVEFHELFNMSADADQLRNIYNSTPQALRQQLAESLRVEYACAGTGCS